MTKPGKVYPGGKVFESMQPTGSVALDQSEQGTVSLVCRKSSLSSFENCCRKVESAEKDGREKTMLGRAKIGGLRLILAFDNWPSVLFSRLFDRKSGFVVYRKNGLDIVIDHHGDDENGTRTCLATDMYLRYLPSFILAAPARVLDLGANGGGFPLMLKAAGIELARVVSVEMNPLTFLRLQLNLATNLGTAAIAINAAVCGMPQDTETLLKPSRGSSSNSMYADRADSSASHVSVRTTTLQALYDQYFENELVDICKVDIESAEYDLFASSPDDLLRKIRYLVIELHDPSRTPQLIEKIAALGFVEITVQEARKTDAYGDVRAFRGPGAE